MAIGCPPVVLDTRLPRQVGLGLLSQRACHRGGDVAAAGPVLRADPGDRQPQRCNPLPRLDCSGAIASRRPAEPAKLHRLGAGRYPGLVGYTAGAGDNWVEDYRDGAHTLLEIWRAADLDQQVPMHGGAQAPLRSRVDHQITELCVHAWGLTRAVQHPISLSMTSSPTTHWLGLGRCCSRSFVARARHSARWCPCQRTRLRTSGSPAGSAVTRTGSRQNPRLDETATAGPQHAAPRPRPGGGAECGS
jgi:hypothetical protein